MTRRGHSFDAAVRRGDFDLVLVRPVSASSYCFVRRREPAETVLSPPGWPSSRPG